jgi:hypothetical protein
VRAWLRPLLGALLTAACGAGGTGPTPPRAHAADVIQHLEVGRVQLCEAFGRCCATSGFAFDRGVCEARARRAFIQPNCRDGASFDAEAAATCVSRAIEMMKRCQDEQDVPACARICAGPKPMGAPCTTTGECAKSDTMEVQCRPVNGVDVCAPRRARQGETCTSTVSRSTPGHAIEWLNGPSQRGGGACYYDDGLYCDPQNRCEPLVVQGGDCQRDVACGRAGWCELKQKKCIPLARVGEACRGLYSCEEDAYCADHINVCEPRKPLGAACQFEGQCFGVCRDGTCSERPPNALATANNCAAAPF